MSDAKQSMMKAIKANKSKLHIESDRDTLPRIAHLPSVARRGKSASPKSPKPKSIARILLQVRVGSQLLLRNREELGVTVGILGQ